MRTEQHRRAGRPSRAEAAAILEQLLDRTMAALRASGFAAVSIDALAAEIGVTKQTIYRRFPSKDALLDAAISRELDRIREAALQAANTHGFDSQFPLQALRKLSESFYFTINRAENVSFTTFLNHSGLGNADVQRKQRHWHDLVVALFVDFIDAAQAKGLITTGDPRAQVHLLHDLLGGGAFRLQRGIDPHVAFDGMSEQAFFDVRYAAFERIALSAMAPDSG